MITVDEFLKGREVEAPLSLELTMNLAKTLAAINYIRGVYGKALTVTSGYRTPEQNAKVDGATNSNHMKCLAIDIADGGDTKHHIMIGDDEFFVGPFAKWCVENIHELRKAGLYMEHPDFTNGWVHLQVVPPASRRTIFIPYVRTAGTPTAK